MHRIVCLIAAAAALLLGLGGQARAAVLFDGRFPAPPAPTMTQAGGNIGNWAFVDFTDPGYTSTLGYVTAPSRRAGGHAADLLVQPAQFGERIEFVRDVFPGTTGEGKDFWLAWSIRVPSGQTLPTIINPMQMFSRYNASLCNTQGAAARQYITVPPGKPWGTPASTWAYVIAGGRGNCVVKSALLTVALVRDQWMDWSCHIKLASTLAAGARTTCYYRALPSGWQLAYDVAAPNCVASASFACNFNVRHGLYRPGTPRPASTRVQQGGLVIATTRAEAEALAFDG